MEVLRSPSSMQEWARRHRDRGHRIGIVPTMGALHEAHLALVDTAREQSDVVVVTIFVNPLQFNEDADFDAYPRPIDDDLTACEAAGVDAVYAPTASVMYDAEFQTHVEPGLLADRLEGSMRPGHFRGVCTVVTKLFGATMPHVAAFGEKDFQQLTIIRRMVRDFDMGVEIIGVPILREPDGLAMSSRNARLTADDRAAAVVVSQALSRALAMFERGERDAALISNAAERHIRTEPRADVEYVEVVDADTLSPVERVDTSASVLAAAWFGDVRLIDNQRLEPPASDL